MLHLAVPSCSIASCLDLSLVYRENTVGPNSPTFTVDNVSMTAG